jgi:hypothetical protein
MQRLPQLKLRLDATAPDADADTAWRHGAVVRWLGCDLTLMLDTTSPAAVRLNDELHVPLPPAATARQIRDAVESWLRDEALRVFSQKSALLQPRRDKAVEQTTRSSALQMAGRQEIGIKLSFGKSSDWARITDGQLRCHWRLIEQPEAVITQVIGTALAHHAVTPVCDDLFAAA